MPLEELVRQLNLGDIGFAGMVVLAITLILRGQLVPKSTVVQLTTLHENEVKRLIESHHGAITRITADRDGAVSRALNEALQWREAYSLREAAQTEQARQMDKLLDAQETTEHLIRSIAERGPQGP